MDCLRVGKLFGGCRFEPRYDEGKPAYGKVECAVPSRAIQFVEASKPRTYVRDVCIRCGRTIERERL